MSELQTTGKELLDQLGQEMKTNFERVDMPPVHRQTPGLYIREVFIPKGCGGLSARHLTEHPFVISKGKILVVSEDGTREVLEAPHTGITMPGTRRALHALEDTIWTTFHPTEETDLVKICDSLVETEDDPQLNQWKEHQPKTTLCHSGQ